MTTIIASYTHHSPGARRLANELGIRIAINDPDRSRLRLGIGDMVINWGMSKLPEHLADAGTILNKDRSVKTAINKISTLVTLTGEDIPTPLWTTDKPTAESWLEDSGVMARTLNRGAQGRGIVFVPKGADPEALPDAPLYTMYVPKRYEYRVHYVCGQVYIRQKLAKRGFEGEVNYRVRSHANGFVYARTLNHTPPDGLAALGAAAVQALGLDFGAADIIYNERRDKLYVLEVNSAPGLVGSSIQEYGDAIKQHIFL